MKNIYKIPQSQLIVIIVFGVIGELVIIGTLSDSYDSNNFLVFLSILIPFLVVFYIAGWKHYNKNKGIKSEPHYKNMIEILDEVIPNKIKDENLKFCSNCGKKNTLDSKFCLECGKEIIN